MTRVFLAAALLCATVAGAQTTTLPAGWQDISTFSGSSSPVGGTALTLDMGALFTIGTFEGTTSIGSFTLTSTGGKDIYVAKYSLTGVCLKAVKLGSAYDDEAYSIASDGTYLYVSGLKDNAGVIYKLDNTTPLGLVTERSLGGGVYPRSIVNGASGKLLIGGSFIEYAYLPSSASTTIDLESSNYSTCLSGGCFDSFLASMNGSDCYINSAVNPEYSDESNEIMSITTRNNHIYATGYFKGGLTWAPGGTTKTKQGVYDVFVASCDVNNANVITGMNNDLVQGGSNESAPGGMLNGLPDWKEIGYGIASNATAIYVTGNLNSGSTPAFGPLSYSGAGAFTLKIDYASLTNDIGTPAWLNTSFSYPSGTAALMSIGYGISLTQSGDIYITGSAYKDALLVGNANSAHVGGAGRPGFVARFNPSGDLVTADAINQSATLNTITEGRGISAVGCAAFTTGKTEVGSFSAGNLSPENLGSGNKAMYVFKFNRDGQIPNNITYCESCASFPLDISGITAIGGSSFTWSPAASFTGSGSTVNFSNSSCSTSGTINASVTISGASPFCGFTGNFTITSGSLATGVANAGADKQVCPATSYTLGGAAAVAGLTYSWSPTTFITGANTAQPVYYNAAALAVPISYTLTVTDVCGNQSTDQVTLTNKLSCPKMTEADVERTTATVVYPNPSNGFFTIERISGENPVMLEVTDLAGKMVRSRELEAGTDSYELDLSAEQAGVYLLYVHYPETTEVVQLVIGR